MTDTTAIETDFKKILSVSEPPILEVENIHKSFGNTEVLKGISFELKKGEVLAIIGSSGSGKTTLLRCLNFLETANKGKISVNGETLFNADAAQNSKKGKSESANVIRDKRLHFGLVFQSFNLFPHYNILHNVTLASELIAKENLQKEYKNLDKLYRGVYKRKEIKIMKAYAKLRILGTIKSKATALLERVGLAERATAYPCELSGGQQQRVAIARALALSPDILCFDEPTSALDPELTGEVLKVIKGLKSGDSTMIVVTHEMEFARNVSDKVIFMANGIIEEAGTPCEVFDNPQSDKTKAFLQKSFEKI